jgi:hypothetical protein
MIKTCSIQDFQDRSNREKNDVRYVAGHHVPLIGIKEAEE